MKTYFETERLILRNLVPDDYISAFEWCGDPEVNKYMIYPLYTKAEDVKTWIESKNIDDPDNYDLGIVLKENGELIGCGGLTFSKERDVWVMGYNIKKKYWGNGYVPEAMQGIIDHIKKVRPVKAVEAEFATENSKSRRVMEKLGMTYRSEYEYTKLDGSVTYPAKLYRIDYE